MAFRYGKREQITLLPTSIDEYIEKDAPVRAYDAIVDSLNFDELGINLKPDRVGAPKYDPRAMLKLLIYGYSYGLRGSRKLERETHYNLSFIWLCGGLKPDHKTIAEFRRKNKSALKIVLKQCARLCVKLDLIAGNTLFVDGTKIRANASIKNSWTKEKCKKTLEEIDKRIDCILSECEVADDQEKDQDSLVRMKEVLQGKEDLKQRVEDILKEVDKENTKSINTIDRDCTRINSVQGSNAGYSLQGVADEKHGLIVSGDVVSENNDLNQFADQIEAANKTLEKKCAIACADSGYASTDELKKINDQGIKVIVPSQRQASKKETGVFAKENFYYDSKKDRYRCPMGKHLTFRRLDGEKKSKLYKITGSAVCRSCPHFGSCTKSKAGRSIYRLVSEEVRQELEKQYNQSDSRAVYKLRQQKIELVFGHLKRNLKVDAFLLRGLDGVRAEASLLFSCFNIVRMIKIIGVQGLIEKLAL